MKLVHVTGWRYTRGFVSQVVLLGYGSALLFSLPLRAAEIYAQDDWTIRWDNTVKYSVGIRAADPNDQYLNNPNLDDGERNIPHGVYSNRLDLRTEFDISNANGYGFSGSADGWYDTIYNQSNDNNSPLTVNQYTASNTGYAKDTRDIEGRYAEVGNAFVYDTINIGDIPVSLRAGRYTLLWGESLFFARNGIANSQSPIDIIKLTSVPDTEAKELFLPESQVSFSAQLTNDLSLQGYYQLEWRRTRLPAAGSYFGFDFLESGGERLYAAPGVAFYRAHDVTPAPPGAAGLALRWSHAGYDFGLYAQQYNDHDPQLYIIPGAGPPSVGPGGSLDIGNYQEVFHKHIQVYGVSASTSAGEFNFAGEVSARHNMDLQSTVTVPPGENPDALYRAAVGDTLHYQASTIYLGPAGFGYDQLQVAAEAAGVHVIDIYKNVEAFSPTSHKDAIGLRTVLTPTWFQVFPGLDVNGELGFGFNFIGNAPTDTLYNGGADKGGDMTLGVHGTYKTVWTGGISYTRFIGPPDRQPYSDRDFVAFTIERTF